VVSEVFLLLKLEIPVLLALLKTPVSHFVLGRTGASTLSGRCGFSVVFIYNFAGSVSVAQKLTRALSGHASPGLANFLAFSLFVHYLTNQHFIACSLCAMSLYCASAISVCPIVFAEISASFLGW